MTYATVPIDEQGFDQQLAQGLTGFSGQAQDDLRNNIMTTIFISGASAQSEGRLPNSLRCWITDLAVVTQTYESFDPVDKFLVSVTASDRTSWVYRMGLNSWTASKCRST